MNTSNHILSQYDISINGFLPDTCPLTSLPDYYAQWDELADNLPKLNSDHSIRKLVKELPVLSTEYLTNHVQVQRAYSILCLIAHSYVWCNQNDPISSLPSSIAVPWMQISSKLGINCILTHAAVDLYNWKLIDPSKGIHLDNMRCIHTMTGTFDEEWFYLVMTHVEYVGGSIISDIMKIYCNPTDWTAMVYSLTSIKNNLIEISRITKRMDEKCDPSVFYNILRPYLRGWDAMIYKGVDDTPKQYPGGSAAQSSLFSTIDAAFGVVHSDTYFEKIKQCMPKKHRDFVQFVKDNINIDHYIITCDEPEIHSQLKSLYDMCITELAVFRKVHFGLVTRYILRMMPKTIDDEGVKGTGGTELNNFLKTSIAETERKKT